MNDLSTLEARNAYFNESSPNTLRYAWLTNHIYFDRVNQKFVAADETGDWISDDGYDTIAEAQRAIDAWAQYLETGVMPHKSTNTHEVTVAIVRAVVNYLRNEQLLDETYLQKRSIHGLCDTVHDIIEQRS